MSEHWEGCWEHHPVCALREIRHLQTRVSQLEAGVIEPEWIQRVRAEGCIPCGEDTHSGNIYNGYGTHHVKLTLHAPDRAAPTWSHGANDEPPSR